MAEDRDDAIRARAHAIWEAEGKPHGKDALHWDQASRELNGVAGEQPDEAGAQDAIDVVESAKAATAEKVGKAPKPATTKTPKVPG